MRVVRWVHVCGGVGSWCLAGGLVVFSSGCGEGASAPTAAAPAQSQAEQDKERAAREAAYGKGGIQQKTAPKPAAK
jgi:hypothetical protein